MIKRIIQILLVIFLILVLAIFYLSVFGIKTDKFNNQISNNMGMLRYTSGGNFKIPSVVRGPGGVGRQLGAEHSQRLEAYFHAVPGIKIVACSNLRTAYPAMMMA